jgi:hypothetical protein
MGSLSYNPNIDIPPYHSNDNSMMYNQDITYKPIMQQMDPRADPRMMESMSMQQMPMQQMPMQQMPMQQMPMQQMPMQKMNNRKPYYNKNMSNKLETLEEAPSSKINWMLILKKIVIYTMLFLIMSHVKMNDLVCHFIPFLNNNEILCMVTKGILLAIIIIIIQMVL